MYNYININIDYVKKLVQMGADLNANMNHGIRVLDIAVMNANYNLIKYILESNKNIIELEVSIDVDGVLEIYILISISGFDINQQNKNGVSYLDHAINNKCKRDIIQMLKNI